MNYETIIINYIEYSNNTKFNQVIKFSECDHADLIHIVALTINDYLNDEYTCCVIFIILRLCPHHSVLLR